MRDISRFALIALGSNQHSVSGDATAIVKKASRLVARASTKPAKLSGFYQNPAFPKGAGPDYINAVIAIDTCSSAHDLLALLHTIETEEGRIRETRWGQRTLDLDLIAMDDTVLPDVTTFNKWRQMPLAKQQTVAPEELILPHPRLQDRTFVLVPLCDVAPDWRHPVLGQTASQMRDALPQAERAEVVRITDPSTLSPPFKNN